MHVVGGREVTKRRPSAKTSCRCDDDDDLAPRRSHRARRPEHGLVSSDSVPTRFEAKRVRPTLKIVVIDPRRTATCEDGRICILPIRAGTDVWLFNGLLGVPRSTWRRRRGVHREQHGRCVSRALLVAENTGRRCESVAQRCRIDPRRLDASIGCSRQRKRRSRFFRKA